MNMKKILYVFLLLTAFSFIQPTTVMAAAGSDQPESPPAIQEVCYGMDYNGCISTPGCYVVYVYQDQDQDQERVAECRQCPADFYCGGGYSVLPCPEGKSSPPQSKSIEDCKVPETCAESYSETICVSSNLGCEWSSSDNKCVKCPSGYYCDSTPPYKHACSTGYTSDEGARTKDECKIVCTEYKTNENWCTTAAGCYYDDDAEECKDCTKGNYCSPQKKEQTPCPLGATSDTGAKSITDCYFSEIIIKENNEGPYIIDPDNRLYFFSTGNSIIIQPQFEILEECFPNFPCD